MKYSSITTTAAILLALTNFDVVVAASRTRGIERADTEHRALSPDKKAGGKGENCRGECKDGAVYYKYVNYASYTGVSGSVSFDYALEKTPFNCVLAPVESAADLLEIQAVIPLSAFGKKEGNAWVGMGKSAADVADDKSDKDRLDDWVNLDGSNVPADKTLWAAGEPNNSPSYQTRAHFYGSNGNPNEYKLRDLNPQGGKGDPVLAAVYKCCFDLCPEEPVDCGPGTLCYQRKYE